MEKMEVTQSTPITMPRHLVEAALNAARGPRTFPAVADALRKALEDGPATPFQSRVQPWMLECFGAEIAADRLERGDRFLEEALELLQSGDYPRDRIAALVDYVYGRPAGEPPQEVGGVMVTLAAYCLAHDLDMHAAAEAELARILQPEIVARIRAKQATKPTGSALPVEMARLEAKASALAQETRTAALATIRTSIFARLIGAMPPATFDHLEKAADEAVEALQNPTISWVFGALTDPGKTEEPGAPAGPTGAKAEVRDGQIVISIDVDDLPLILSGSIASYAVDGTYKVTDADAFAKEVCHALNDESEDGTTRVHEMFDSAFNHVIDQGGEGVEEISDDEFEVEAARLRASAAACRSGA